MNINTLFKSELQVVNFGMTAFKDALAAVGAKAVHVDWKPPMDVSPAAMERIAAARAKIEKADRKSVV